MQSLIKKINELKKGKVKKLVASKIKEFKKAKSYKELFSELCYCIMTAGFNAERSINIQKAIGNGFLALPEKKLQARLKELGYRYHNRAEYIASNRKYAKELKKRIESMQEHDLREWLAKNIKGFGYKEASHFLRNIGYCDCAIIDFHIIDLLEKYHLIKKPKALTKKSYLGIERILRDLAKKSKLTLDELDLYLWYLETGKVLK